MSTSSGNLRHCSTDRPCLSGGRGNGLGNEANWKKVWRFDGRGMKCHNLLMCNGRLQTNLQSFGKLYLTIANTVLIHQNKMSCQFKEGSDAMLTIREISVCTLPLIDSALY